MSNWDDSKGYRNIRQLPTTYIKEVKPNSIVFSTAQEHMSQLWGDITSMTYFESFQHFRQCRSWALVIIMTQLMTSSPDSLKQLFWSSNNYIFYPHDRDTFPHDHEQQKSCIKWKKTLIKNEEMLGIRIKVSTAIFWLLHYKYKLKTSF